MRKLIIIFSFIAFIGNLSAQTTIECTVDTFYFYIQKHDTIVLEPTMVTPGMAVTSNYQAVGAELYMSDTMQNCINQIEADSLKLSDYSIALFEIINNTIYVQIKDFNSAHLAFR